MELRAFQYKQKQGWSVEQFPALDSENTLVLIFASPLFINDPEPIKQITNFYDKSKIIGCSTAGEIFADHIVDNSLSIVVAKFDNTSLKMAKAKVNRAADSRKAGKEIANQLISDELKGIFVLSDGLNINGSELVQGLNAGNNGKNLVITGGLAGDGNRFKKTWTICNGEICDNHVVAVGFYGDHIHIGHGSKGGWDIFGPIRRVTRSEGNILYELDYQPALQLYKEYLGEKAAELPSSGLLYPLAIQNPSSKNSTKLVRTILGIDEKEQSLIFAGDIPTGFFAQLMRANFDRLIDSAHEAGELANERMLVNKKNNNKQVLAIDISCVGRRLLLGERTEEEVETTLESLPADSIQIGFYSYGELSPFHVGNCELHNQTMTITTYYED